MFEGRRPKFFAGVSFVAFSLLLAFTSLFLLPSKAPAQPTVYWSPASLNEIGVAGSTKNVPVFFTASENITNATAWIIPELQPYLQVLPDQLGTISKGQKIQLSVTIAPSATASPATVFGTIHIRSGRESKRTSAKPLPVTLNIVWPTLIEPGFFYSVSYPGNWVIERPSLGERLPFSHSITFKSEPDVLSGITFNVIETSLNVYLASIDESTTKVSQVSENINGIEWLRIVYVDTELPRSYESAFTEKNGYVYQLVFRQGFSEDQEAFENMIRSFKFTN